MVLQFALSASALFLLQSVVHASPSAILPLASHRAAYDLSLVDPTSPSPSSVRTPIAASGLIAYEFRGSPCEGYTSSFRQLTQMERSEGEPLSTQVNAVSFEDADGKSMRFRVEFGGSSETPPVVGTATREARRRPARRIDQAVATGDRLWP